MAPPDAGWCGCIPSLAPGATRAHPPIGVKHRPAAGLAPRGARTEAAGEPYGLVPVVAGIACRTGWSPGLACHPDRMTPVIARRGTIEVAAGAWLEVSS